MHCMSMHTHIHIYISYRKNISKIVTAEKNNLCKPDGRNLPPPHPHHSLKQEWSQLISFIHTAGAVHSERVRLLYSEPEFWIN